MIPIILAFSFILHLLTIFVIILLYLRIQKMKGLEKKQTTLIREFEDVFHSYIMEMREENDKLIDRIEKSQLKSSMQPYPENLKLNQKPTLVTIKPTTNAKTKQNKVDEELEEKKEQSENKYEDYSPPMPNEQKDVYVESTVSQALMLRSQGHSIEAIAKKLNKGKGEIELLLKFRDLT